MAKQFKKLAAMIKAEQHNEIAEQFLVDLQYTMEKENETDYVPTKSFKPSGISSCRRALYYQLTGVMPDTAAPDTNLVGICESGTHRHDDIQSYVCAMSEYGIDCEWLDVGDYIIQNDIPDLDIIGQRGHETKLYSTKYNMRFMCDGLIRYKGELYILEIKTESSRKYGSHSEPHADHKLQAACYSMTLQVPKVIFIYENRDVCSKKGFLFEVPNTMVEYVEDIINSVNKAVADNVIPCKESDKCCYCKYKTQCMKDGE